jgi:hypothetical protein
MQKEVNPKLFIGVIAVVVIIAGFFVFKAFQSPTPKPAKPSANPLANPNSAEYRQGMINSMRRSPQSH